jgi:putative transposase
LLRGSSFTNSYTKYFNTKYERVGSLFQGLFKSVWAEDDEQLIHLSRYIHINPVVSYVVEERELAIYQWSSLSEYLGAGGFRDKDLVLGQFSSVDDYRDFVFDQISYARDFKKIEHLTFE